LHNADKLSSTEMNDFDFDYGEDIVAEEDDDNHHLVDNMFSKLTIV